MGVTFISPCYNASRNLDSLVRSLTEQTDPDWHLILIDDVSDDDTADRITGLCHRDSRISGIINKEKKYALRNVVEAALQLPDDMIVANIDGDDELCNVDTVKLLKEAYASGAEVVWTGQKWDINERMNVSGELPNDVNPYNYPWCTSHLKTWRSALLKQVPLSNFKDHQGEWYKRGYDQALFLPLLHLAKGKRKFIPDVCYLYKINSVSMIDRSWVEKRQLSTVNFVRARGYLDA